MKKALFAAAVLVVAGSLASIVGIVADPNNLTFWSQALLWCLLGTVLVVPALVFAGSSSPPADAAAASTARRTSEPPASGRSLVRSGAYAFSGIAVVWTAISLVSLFVYPEHLAFWTQSVLWSLLVLLVWAPVMTFVVNPFDDPALADAPAQEATLHAESAIAGDHGVPESPQEDVPDFIPDPAVPTVQPRSIPRDKDAEIDGSIFDEPDPAAPSNVRWPEEPSS
jgi:hypothetical protein